MNGKIHCEEKRAVEQAVERAVEREAVEWAVEHFVAFLAQNIFTKIFLIYGDLHGLLKFFQSLDDLKSCNAIVLNMLNVKIELF